MLWFVGRNRMYRISRTRRRCLGSRSRYGHERDEKETAPFSTVGSTERTWGSGKLAEATVVIDPWALGHKTSFVQMDACCISRWYGHIQIQQDKCLRTHKGQQVLSPLSIRPGEAARPSDMGAQAHPEPFLSGRCWSLRPLLPVLLPMPQPPPKGVHLSLTPPYPNSPTDYVARGGLSVSF